MFNLNTENILLLVTGLINLILFVVVSIRLNKTKNTWFFLLFNGSVFSWVISVALFKMLDVSNVLLKTIPQIIYMSAAVIPLSLVLFIETFPNRKLKLDVIKLFFICFIPVCVIVASILPNLVTNGFDVGLDGVRYIKFGPLEVYYSIYIFLYFLFGLFRMVQKYFLFTGIAKNRMKIIFFSILLSSLVGMTTNLLLPSFGNFNLFWLGPVFSLYMVITIGYAIIKYGLFETKIITTEFATFFLWGIMLMKVVFSRDINDRIVSMGLFIIIVSVGVYIIKQAIKELSLRDDVAKINDTLIKKNLELDRISAEKSEFVSLASHQIRAPLTSIRGYVSLLKEGDFGVQSKEAMDALGVIDTSCTTLSTVVNDYLDVSRIEQGKMHFDFVNIDVRELLNECITEITPSFTKNKLTCINNVPVKTVETENMFDVRADRSKLKQVIMNIIDNSIKYTPKGSISITTCKKDDHTVRIEVKDTGLGIDPKVMPKLFMKFSRAPDATEANILGTGLGLFIAKSFIEAHEGKVWAESEGIGKGSLFIIELKGV